MTHRKVTESIFTDRKCVGDRRIDLLKHCDKNKKKSVV